MSATGPSSTGFCRVTVVAPDRRIDVALPDDVPVAELRAHVLHLSGQNQAEGEPAGFNLVRRDGTVLEGGLSLSAQRVLDGELLALRPYADSLPPPVYDDVVDAIATAVERDNRRWNDELMRAGGLTGGFVLLVMTGFVLWFADPHRHDMHALPGVLAGVIGVVLTAFAGVRARAYDDRASAVALGLAALPHLMIAGSGIVAPDSGEGAGRMQFLVACVTVLVASVLLIALLPYGDAPFVAAALLSAAGALATFGVIAGGSPPRYAAAVAGVCAVALVGFLPGWSARFARLPIGFRAQGESTEEPVDYRRIAAQAQRGHELLLGLVCGCSAVVVGAVTVLGFSDSGWAQLLALATAVAAMLRARLFRYTAQVAALLAAGVVGLGLLALGLALNLPVDLLKKFAQGDHGPLDTRTVWITAAVVAGAALLTAIALIVPRKGVSLFWGRTLDIGEAAVLLSLVPLCLAVLKIYSRVRGSG
ncbi:type VII secretion integral membrane protein EccD [Streptomyces sp. KK5PA1]|uniref:Type VII secretion integral membrane protein EccD n=1 Tax=Actinacidiphila acididurans TaxID=2784346 RepID=A0ABS2TP43_9ACTN|nr:type VII secretion integral membrane protein EccD [Actinacidiphila acididurans]MBM9504005.1 type VII secretion integral membrane protein EccD [Actinacidiphila acididurans]